MELSQLTWESYAKYKIVTKNLYCSTISQQKKTVPNIRIGFHNTWIKLKCLAPKNPPLHLSLSVASYNVRPFLAIRFRARCWERMIFFITRVLFADPRSCPPLRFFFLVRSCSVIWNSVTHLGPCVSVFAS